MILVSRICRKEKYSPAPATVSVSVLPPISAKYINFTLVAKPIYKVASYTNNKNKLRKPLI